MKPVRLYQIDLLRFIAAFMILIYHYTFRGYAADNMSIMPYPLMAGLAKYTHLGVNLFFVISGFVILMTASSGSPRRFIISRIVRLYPAFWVCCTTSFLIAIAFGGTRFKVTPGQYLVNMTMLSGFVGIPPIDGAYWSLFVEMKFYFLVFVVLILGLINRAELFVSMWLLVSLALTKWPIPHAARFLIPEFCPCFVAGAILFLIYKNGVNFFRMFILLMSYVFAVWHAIARAQSVATHYGVKYQGMVIAIVLLLIFGVMFLVSIRKADWLATPQWLTLGALTYPLYLIHQHVGYIFINLAYPVLNTHVILLTITGVVLLYAYCVSEFVERKYSPRLKHLLERYLLQKRQAVSPAQIDSL